MVKRISGRIAAHGKKWRVEFGKHRGPIQDTEEQARADLVRLRYVPLNCVENEIFTIKMASPEPKPNDREVALAWRNLLPPFGGEVCAEEFGNHGGPHCGGSRLPGQGWPFQPSGQRMDGCLADVRGQRVGLQSHG